MFHSISLRKSTQNRDLSDFYGNAGIFRFFFYENEIFWKLLYVLELVGFYYRGS